MRALRGKLYNTKSRMHRFAVGFAFCSECFDSHAQDASKDCVNTLLEEITYFATT